MTEAEELAALARLDRLIGALGTLREGVSQAVRALRSADAQLEALEYEFSQERFGIRPDRRPAAPPRSEATPAITLRRGGRSFAVLELMRAHRGPISIETLHQLLQKGGDREAARRQVRAAVASLHEQNLVEQVSLGVWRALPG